VLLFILRNIWNVKCCGILVQLPRPFKCSNSTIIQTRSCLYMYTGEFPSVSSTFNSYENHCWITTACTRWHEVWATRRSTALARHNGRCDRQPSEKVATDRLYSWTLVPRVLTVRDVRPSDIADLSRVGQGWTGFSTVANRDIPNSPVQAEHLVNHSTPGIQFLPHREHCVTVT